MSNVLSENILEKYDLSGYVGYGSPQYVEINDRTYCIQTYQGRHMGCYTIHEMKDDNYNGSAFLYKDGVLQRSWEMQNGEYCGDIVLYKNGDPLYKVAWSEIYKVNENPDLIVHHVLNRPGEKWTVEERVGDEILIFRGEYNDDMERDGFGVEFDSNGVEWRSGYYKRRRCIHISQLFYKDEEENCMKMIEYEGNCDEDNVSNPLMKRPIYVGSYCYDEKEYRYKRDGLGYEINRLTGLCEKTSRWKRGVSVHHNSEHRTNGWMRGEGIHLPVLDAVVNAIKSRNIPKKVTISSYYGIEENENIENYIVEEKSYNELYDVNKYGTFQFIDFPLLRYIEIGSFSAQRVRLLSISDLPKLKSIIIKDNCFRVHEGWDGDGEKERTDGKLIITNCNALHTIELGDNSFCDYSTFEISELPSLTSICFGSFCFLYAKECFIQSERYKNDLII